MLLQSAARLSPSAAILDDIARPDCNLAVWERPAIPGLDLVLESAERDVRFTADIADVRAELERELTQAGYRGTPQRDELMRDIGDLAERFSAIMAERRVEVRLEIVTTDSCRKFHGDYVDARLITSYVGSGTQWIDDDDAQRVAKGEEPKIIRSLEPGDVGIFKGKLATDHPAIHRSPPISTTGEVRLLLVLNPGSDS